MRLLPLLVFAVLLSACASPRIAGQPRDVKQAAVTPLYDINVLRTKIPVALIEAEERPYEVPQPLNCRTIETAVIALDDALGPDLDTLPTQDNPSAMERSAQVARNAGVALVEGGTASLVPFRSWVRRLSGAERNDRIVREAIVAGAIRRSYLKGLGFLRNCAEPARPTTPALAGQDLNPPPPKLEPKFPIR